MGGAKILLDTKLSIIPERFASLHIFFPHNTLEVTGRVVWVREFNDRKEVGVCFVDNFDPSKDVFNYIMRYFRDETTGRNY